MQSRKGSLLEVLQNVLVGLGISITANAFVFPLILGVQVKFIDNLTIGAIMTVISICRSYGLRRYNNYKTERGLKDEF